MYLIPDDNLRPIKLPHEMCLFPGLQNPEKNHKFIWRLHRAQVGF